MIEINSEKEIMAEYEFLKPLIELLDNSETINDQRKSMIHFFGINFKRELNKVNAQSKKDYNYLLKMSRMNGSRRRKIEEEKNQFKLCWVKNKNILTVYPRSKSNHFIEGIYVLDNNFGDIGQFYNINKIKKSITEYIHNVQSAFFDISKIGDLFVINSIPYSIITKDMIIEAINKIDKEYNSDFYWIYRRELYDLRGEVYKSGDDYIKLKLLNAEYVNFLKDDGYSWFLTDIYEHYNVPEHWGLHNKKLFGLDIDYYDHFDISVNHFKQKD